MNKEVLKLIAIQDTIAWTKGKIYDAIPVGNDRYDIDTDLEGSWKWSKNSTFGKCLIPLDEYRNLLIDNIVNK